MQDANIEVENVVNFASLPLATFKKEIDFEKASYFLTNLLHNRKSRVIKHVEFLDDVYMQIKLDKESKCEINPTLRMHGPFQCDNLVLTDSTSPLPGIYVPKQGGEILVNFFSYSAWIDRKNISIWDKKTEHFRVHVKSCQDSCCYDSVAKTELTIKQKLSKVLSAFDPSSTLLDKTKSVATKSYSLAQLNEQVFPKYKESVEVSILNYSICIHCHSVLFQGCGFCTHLTF